MGPNTNTPNFNTAPQMSGAESIGNQLPQYNVGNDTTHNSGPNNYNQYNQAPLNNGEQLSAAEALAQPMQGIPAMSQPVQQSVTPVPTVTSVPAKPVESAQLEKEYVGRAKTTINANRSDPYELAHQVALLMKEYLRDRYGKIISK